MKSLEPNFRLGVRPEDILLALHRARRRFRHRREAAADKKRNKEYYKLWIRAYRARMRGAQ
jgi:hypothetical protein